MVDRWIALAIRLASGRASDRARSPFLWVEKREDLQLQAFFRPQAASGRPHGVVHGEVHRVHHLHTHIEFGVTD